MKFSVDWLDHGINASSEERSTLCNLSIYVAGKNLCSFVDYRSVGTVEDHITIPAVHLAEGIAQDWWNIFGSRDKSHSIQRYRTGFALPDLRFRADGAFFEVSGTSSSLDNPYLKFTENASEMMTRESVQQTLSQFVFEVVNALSSSLVTGSELTVCWDRVRRSQQDNEESLFCEAAGALGLDPYEIPEESAQLIESVSSLFTDESLIELLAGVRDVDQSCFRLDRIKEVETRPERVSLLPDIPGIATEISSSVDILDRPWANGYRVARAFRRAISAGPEVRFHSEKRLAQRLGSTKFDTTDLFGGIYALVSRKEGNVHVHLKDRSDDSHVARKSNNFAFARAVGDALIFRNSERSVINSLRHAHQQATGRAFAAELLAPIEEISEMRADGLDSEEISDEFGVSSVLIEDQIENTERIYEACA